ncbi:Endonuclease/exonuclease/phosphatase [Parasponia andersonii]|uniref:Endonuclease/exonuclease/phosphatase n=1 Tax=Parasponia andersonii TaxID=3476 RepID=A0A2P5DUB5_PARAD|nr:Endonuclease/exonuclease/phosphatase [Parasponia andersonii]
MEEKKGGTNKAPGAILDFRMALSDCELSNLNFSGPVFTWQSKHDGQIYVQERLDRFLSDEQWRALFPFADIQHYSKSDHRPIILRLEGYPRWRHIKKENLFCFEPFWLREDDCVKEWSKTRVGTLKIALKLKREKLAWLYEDCWISVLLPQIRVLEKEIEVLYTGRRCIVGNGLERTGLLLGIAILLICIQRPLIDSVRTLLLASVMGRVFGGRMMLNCLRAIRNILEKSLGQKINLDKSSITFSPNVSDQDQESYRLALKIDRKNSYDTYLGFSTVISRGKRCTFTTIKDKVWKRVQGWRRGLFSLGGKEVLIKSILQAVPNYVISLFKLSSPFMRN